MKIDADLNIVSTDLREYVFRAEDGCLVQCGTNLICLEIWDRGNVGCVVDASVMECRRGVNNIEV